MKLAVLLDAVVGRIERAEFLDGPNQAIAQFSAKLVGSSRLASDLGSGAPIGHPVHPLFVAFPIGSWATALVFDALGKDEAARTAIAVGVLAAVPTAFAGHHDWSYTAGAEQRVGTVHAALNNVAISAYAASWLARRAGNRRAGVVLSLIGGSALGAAGWLGGHLAYAMGVGVDTTAFQHSEPEWTRVAAESDVPKHGLLGSDLGGVPVLLTRDADGRVVALADRCTHRGAPLHEGRLVDGCVVCPWHDSEFALDGSVVRGPASRPQPAYEVDLRAGDVYLRRPDEPRTLRTNPVGV